MIEENSYVLHLALEIANSYTKEEIQRMLDDKNKINGMTLNEYIMDLVCQVFEVNVEDMKGKSRKYQINMARQMIMYFLRMYNPTITLKQIGIFLGNRDHSTVLWGIEQSQSHLFDEAIKKKFDFIDDQLKATLCV